MISIFYIKLQFIRFRISSIKFIYQMYPHLRNVASMPVLNKCLHRLEITYLGPSLYQPTTYLINCKFHWSVLGPVRWAANHVMPSSPHCL